MKKNFLRNWIIVAIALLPLVYLTIIWNTLPQVVPTHFGADMKPDKMGSKSELWVVVGFIALISILVYLLFQNIRRIDPKRKDAPPSATFNKLAAGMVVFMAALNFIIIHSAQGNLVSQNLLFPLMGLMFAFIGNYMNHIKPNYFAGFRLPWTLSNDENWRKTHQLGGKLWFAGGILIAILGLLLPPIIVFPLFIAIMVVIVIIPVIYSYRLFKHHSPSAH